MQDLKEQVEYQKLKTMNQRLVEMIQELFEIMRADRIAEVKTRFKQIVDSEDKIKDNAL
jgi:hypothetical protein